MIIKPNLKFLIGLEIWVWLSHLWLECVCRPLRWEGTFLLFYFIYFYYYYYVLFSSSFLLLLHQPENGLYGAAGQDYQPKRTMSELFLSSQEVRRDGMRKKNSWWASCLGQRRHNWAKRGHSCLKRETTEQKVAGYKGDREIDSLGSKLEWGDEGDIFVFFGKKKKVGLGWQGDR